MIVLSNNDGCTVARSSEAKSLGIGMGEPWFKLAAGAGRMGLVAKSSNYELYGEMSARVMKLLARFSAWVEVYSIDEAFLGVRPVIFLIAPKKRIIGTVVRPISAWCLAPV